MLLCKIAQLHYEKYFNYILPRKSGEKEFEDFTHSDEFFSDTCSLFHARWSCLNLTRKEDDDFVMYLGTVNREYEQFKLK